LCGCLQRHLLLQGAVATQFRQVGSTVLKASIVLLLPPPPLLLLLLFPMLCGFRLFAAAAAVWGGCARVGGR
jgi:hypothetical protein